MATLDDPHVIATARLRLRVARAGDEEQLFPLFDNWEVIRWLSAPPWPYRREDMENFVRAQQSTGPEEAETRFVIGLDAILIGLIGVRMRPASSIQRNPGPNVGYWLGQPYWGRGYMTEVLRGVVAHVFATTAHDEIHAGVFVGNTGSLRAQEKLGFTPYGESMVFSNPQQKEMPHISTALTRARFAAKAPQPA
jgi:RimJ/RimL family protein N-acetyltransferase